MGQALKISPAGHLESILRLVTHTPKTYNIPLTLYMVRVIDWILFPLNSYTETSRRVHLPSWIYLPKKYQLCVYILHNFLLLSFLKTKPKKMRNVFIYMNCIYTSISDWKDTICLMIYTPIWILWSQKEWCLWGMSDNIKKFLCSKWKIQTSIYGILEHKREKLSKKMQYIYIEKKY